MISATAGHWPKHRRWGRSENELLTELNLQVALYDLKLPPHPVAVTTRITTFLVRDPDELGGE